MLSKVDSEDIDEPDTDKEKNYDDIVRMVWVLNRESIKQNDSARLTLIKILNDKVYSLPSMGGSDKKE